MSKDETPPSDPWATDTADPARIFNQMFPASPPAIDWRLFSAFEDLIARGVIEVKGRDGRVVR